MMTTQMQIWSEAITASEFCLLFDRHNMAIFNIRLLHIRLCLRPTSAIPYIKLSDSTTPEIACFIIVSFDQMHYYIRD